MNLLRVALVYLAAGAYATALHTLILMWIVRL